MLSAPFDPKQDEPISTIQSGGPPPTAVLPADSGRRETEMTPAPLPPTIASSASDARGSKPLFPPHLEPMVSAAKRSKLPFIAISALVLIILLGSVSLFAFKRAQCSKVKIYCSQYLNFATCFLDNEEPDLRIRSNANPKEDIGPATSSLHPIMALQAAVMPKGISNIKWTISPGKTKPQGLAPTELLIPPDSPVKRLRSKQHSPPRVGFVLTPPPLLLSRNKDPGGNSSRTRSGYVS